ncbi:HAD hydrolase family protein (plasmid) [Rhizobium sp. L51/94]|nr:HAD hydrolase family protein [Rhizobium sp. L51/94]
MFGISPAQCIAAGDGENDLSMLNFAGLKLTVANAIEPVKHVADFIGGTCENGGLADGLRWIISRNRYSPERQT